MTVAAVVQARMTSTRLPGKVLLPLAGAPLLVRMLERVTRITGVDRVCAAVAIGAEHDPVADAAATVDGVTVVRGSETDVLDRTLLAAEHCGADIVMRITSDCPLVDPAVSAAVLAVYRATHAVYARTAFRSGFPHGFDTEVFAMEALRAAHAEATDPFEREHVTPFIWRRPDRFHAVFLDSQPDHRAWRLTVDTPEDYALATAIYDALYPAKPTFGYREIVALFEARPDLRAASERVRADIPGAPGAVPRQTPDRENARG
jgi:spore coat polysaccharide biosynthesis protein SpsF